MSEVLHINLEALNEAFVQDIKKQYGAVEVKISIQKTPENWLPYLSSNRSIDFKQTSIER
ncbi:MAG: hypothetical protein AAB316_09705 [Bacteroidota bacterium]